MRTRQSLVMPSSRPRRIWLNSVGASNGSAKEEELRKSLPYCDIETGTRNRVVERDPISGLGELGCEHDPILENRIKLRSVKDRENRNPISGEGNLGKEASSFIRNTSQSRDKSSRNPLLAAEKQEADTLRPKGRPGRVIIHSAQRDPISGRGEFGREWDPIYKYAGRPRNWHPQVKDAKRGGRCNPVTGEDAKSFEINSELRRRPRKEIRRTNPVTGENCASFTVSDKFNEKYNKTGAKVPSANANPLTGANCKSFDFNIESRPVTARRASAGNPVTGERCQSFAYSCEFKPKSVRNAVAQNPVTGENVRSFILRQTEKLKCQQASSGSAASKNPLTGSNCASFSFSREERPRTAPSSLGSSRCNPVTGENCNHYVLATDEKKLHSGGQSHVNANPVTGENVNSYDINREMRINRRSSDYQKTGNCSSGSSGCTTPQSARSNPITGESR